MPFAFRGPSCSHPTDLQLRMFPCSLNPLVSFHWQHRCQTGTLQNIIKNIVPVQYLSPGIYSNTSYQVLLQSLDCTCCKICILVESSSSEAAPKIANFCVTCVISINSVVTFLEPKFRLLSSLFGYLDMDGLFRGSKNCCWFPSKDWMVSTF